MLFIRLQSVETLEECKERADAQPDADVRPEVEQDTHHGFDHGHHNHGHHGHGHGHQGDNDGFHPRGFGHGHGHHGHPDVAGHDHGQSQQGVRHRGHEQDFSQMQQAVHTLEMSQQAHAAPARP